MSSLSAHRLSCLLITHHSHALYMSYLCCQHLIPIAYVNNLATRCMHDIVGQAEWVHVQNVDQLHAYDCYQNVTERWVTEYHTKIQTCTTKELWVRPSAWCTQVGSAQGFLSYFCTQMVQWGIILAHNTLGFALVKSGGNHLSIDCIISSHVPCGLRKHGEAKCFVMVFYFWGRQWTRGLGGHWHSQRLQWF